MVFDTQGAGSRILTTAGKVKPIKDVAAFVSRRIMLLPNIKVVVFEVKILAIQRFFFGRKLVEVITAFGRGFESKDSGMDLPYQMEVTCAKPDEFINKGNLSFMGGGKSTSGVEFGWLILKVSQNIFLGFIIIIEAIIFHSAVEVQTAVFEPVRDFFIVDFIVGMDINIAVFIALI